MGRLRAAQHESGGWAYGPSGTLSSEPTALACLAIKVSGETDVRMQRGLDWLAARQQSDGSVGVNAQHPTPGWATGLAILAWKSAAKNVSAIDQRHQKSALEWLLRTEGKPFKSNPAIYGHNTRLRGWAWIEGTHSWIEPTAYAVLALRAGELSKHPRTREAIALMLDRALPQGGWNYGNSVMFGNALRPFPAQTGMVLAALAGEQGGHHIEKALNFLHNELPRVRTPISLGWGIVGARAWHDPLASADAWLAECAERLESAPPNPIYDALLLLADAKACPLIHEKEGVARGV